MDNFEGNFGDSFIYQSFCEAKAKMEWSIAEATISFYAALRAISGKLWINLEDNFEDNFRDNLTDNLEGNFGDSFICISFFS